MKIDLEFYIGIIEDFLNKRIPPKCFEYIYLKLFLEGMGKPTSKEFAILNPLFMDVEAFCDNPELADKDDIGEKELRFSCKVALEKLRQLKKTA